MDLNQVVRIMDLNQVVRVSMGLHQVVRAAKAEAAMVAKAVVAMVAKAVAAKQKHGLQGLYKPA